MESNVIGVLFSTTGVDLRESSSGKQFLGFVPAISNRAKRDIRQIIKRWRIHQKTSETIENLAKWINPPLRVWVNYYGKFNRSEMQSSSLQVEYYLKRWFRKKLGQSTILLE